MAIAVESFGLQLSAAIEAGRAALARAQDLDGAWHADSDLGPVATAQVSSALAYTGQLDAADARQLYRWFRSVQRGDGGFESYPGSERSSLAVTVSVWSALVLMGYQKGDPVLDRAAAYVDSNGGLQAVRGLLSSGDLAPLFAACAGLIDPQRLTVPPLGLALFPRIIERIEQRFHAGVPLSALQLAAILDQLRGRTEHPGTIRRRATALLLSRSGQWLNRDGSVNGSSVQTALMLMAFHAASVDPTDGRVRDMVSFLRRCFRRTRRGMWVVTFAADVWTTALSVRALLRSGSCADDPEVVRGIRYLLSAQSRRPQPKAMNPSASRTGGWAFQRDNTTMVDCDDTGMVLGTLGEWLAASPKDVDLKRHVTLAVERGRRWLVGMQNPSGGFPAFQHGQPEKRTGTCMDRTPKFPSGLREATRFWRHPPEVLTDCATEDVTARALLGLLATGSRRTDAEIARGLAFVTGHQLPEGPFWGRWVTNFVPTTAHVLSMAVAAGHGPEEPFVERAVRWLERHQNEDGGFGERPESYRDPTLAGRGPSAPETTALVLSALCELGLQRRASAARAAEYLVQTQLADGTWSSEGTAMPFLPPDSFYRYPGAAAYAPVEALAAYRAARPSDGRTLPKRTRDGRHVVVVGGGVAGMTAAHELAERGYHVTVLDARTDSPGGKARSVDAKPGRGGRLPLPGEHGFRFFPGFYRHLDATMRRIPYGKNPNGVYDNLIPVREVMLAHARCRARSAPASRPRTLKELRAAVSVIPSWYSFGVLPKDVAFLWSQLLRVTLMGESRRFAELDELSWAELLDFPRRGAAFEDLFGSGQTQNLIAVKAKDASARTTAVLLLRLFRDLFTTHVARVLCGPTSDVFLNPWLHHLKTLGVKYVTGARATELVFDGERVTGVRYTSSGKQHHIRTDATICALPVERVGALLDDRLRRALPSLAHLDELTRVTATMIGIQYYVGHDVEFGPGHVNCLKTPWALTAITQQQTWPTYSLDARGDGSTKSIVSVDISNFDAPGIPDGPAKGKPARSCTPREIADEVWAQLSYCMQNAGIEMGQYDDFHLPDSLETVGTDAFGNPVLESAEPLFVNAKGSWKYRPEAATAIPNFFLAGDWVRTRTDLSCMEGANEAARRAVNALLVSEESEAAPCRLFEPEDDEPLAWLRAVDDRRFAQERAWRPPHSAVASRVRRLFGSLRAASNPVDVAAEG